MTTTTEPTLVQLPADVAVRLIDAATLVCSEEMLADALYLVTLQAPAVVQTWLTAYDDVDMRDLLRLGAERAGVT